MFIQALFRYIHPTIAGLVIALAGCWPVASDSDSDILASSLPWDEQVLGSHPPQPSSISQYTETEPNNWFEDAEPVLGTDHVRISGGIAGTSSMIAPETDIDRDIFQVDSAGPGSRLSVTITLQNSGDLALGLFNEDDELLAYLIIVGDKYTTRQTSVFVREPANNVYLLVTGLSRSSTTCDYLIEYAVESVTDTTAPRPQLLILNFKQANDVRIGNRAPVMVPSFDASRISPQFAGQDEIIIQGITENVRNDYAGLNVQIYRSDDPDIPAGDRTIVHFGTYNPDLLGLADSLDPYNAEAEQEAIVFTDTFSLFNPLLPSTAEITQAIANVASHEAGHLRGLRHTADPLDLMDITATALQMIEDQSFRKAALQPTILPVGFQDAPDLLAWAVGGTLLSPSPAAHPKPVRERMINPSNRVDFQIPHGLLGTCVSEVAIGQ